MAGPGNRKRKHADADNSQASVSAPSKTKASTSQKKASASKTRQPKQVKAAKNIATNAPPKKPLDLVATTFKGHSYEHGLGELVHPCFIVANKASSKTLKNYIKELTEKGGTLSRPSLDPSEAEDGEPDEQHPQYLWVGLTLLKEKGTEFAEWTKLGPGAEKRKAVGVAVHNGVTATMNGEKTKPLRVVVPITTKPDAPVTPHVLVDRNDEGYCSAFVIQQEAVYYFHAYRNMSTSNEARKKEWNDLVRPYTLLKSGTMADERDPRTVHFKKAHDRTRITVEPSISWVNELTQRVAMMAIHGGPDKHSIEQLCDHIASADPDKTGIQLPDRSFFKRFCDPDIGITDEAQAQELISDVEQFWPQLEYLNFKPREIIVVSTGLREKSITLDQCYLPSLLVMAVTLLRYLPNFTQWGHLLQRDVSEGLPDIEGLGELVTEAHNLARATPLHTYSPAASMSERSFTTALDTVSKSVSAIAEYQHEYAKQLRDNFGDPLTKYNDRDALDMFASVGPTYDIGVMKVAFGESLRKCNLDLIKPLETGAELLSRVVASIDALRPEHRDATEDD